MIEICRIAGPNRRTGHATGQDIHEKSALPLYARIVLEIKQSWK